MREQSCRLPLDIGLEKRQERMHLAKAREIHFYVTTFLQLPGNQLDSQGLHLRYLRRSAGSGGEDRENQVAWKPQVIFAEEIKARIIH